MSDYLAYGVTFAISDTDFVLLEKGNKRIPMAHIARIEVQVTEAPKVSKLAIAFGAMALISLIAGWGIWMPLVFAGGAFFFYRRGPSKTQIYRAYVWTNHLSDESAPFTVANHELPMLESALSRFPEVTLQI